MADEQKSFGVAEFIAGCLGGFAQVMIGQPFDIVKVRLQTQKVGEATYTGALDCLQKIIKNEGGVLSLWRGSLPPLIGVGAASSIQFGVNENTKMFMQNFTGTKELSALSLAFCGAVAGVANSTISAPAEHIRIRIQSQGTMANPPYKGSIDCISKIFSQYGVKGLYKGGVATVWREFFAYAIYFSTYDLSMRRLAGGDPNPETYKIATAGAIAGICFWFSVFPIDIIKTKMQIDSFNEPKYNSTWDCVRQLYRSQGFGGFWRGLTPCLLRSVPVNSGTFIVYNYSLDLMKGRKKEVKGLSVV